MRFIFRRCHMNTPSVLLILRTYSVLVTFSQRSRVVNLIPMVSQYRGALQMVRTGGNISPIGAYILAAIFLFLTKL